LKVRSSKGESAEKALLDSGASFTDVRKDIAEKFGYILPISPRHAVNKRREKEGNNFYHPADMSC
jgi:predicted aspartyl protease